MLDEEVYEGELKDLRRFIRESDHESRLMEIELRKTKHALWMAMALRALTEAAFWARCGNDFDQSDIKHQYHILAEKWNWAARKCLQKAKEFE